MQATHLLARGYRLMGPMPARVSKVLRCACLVAGLALAISPVRAARSQPDQQQKFELTALLETYAAGRFDETIQAIERAGDTAARNIRLDWPTIGRKWIDKTPEDRRRRLLVAASLALEMEKFRSERGEWNNNTVEICEVMGWFGSDGRGSAPQCVINWAYSLLLERGRPDEAEYAWGLAATALLEGVRDWRFLHLPSLPPSSRLIRPAPRGFLERALDRFPDDARLKFHQALAVASRFNVTVDGGRLTNDPSQMVIAIVGDQPGLRITPPREDAVLLLSALINDPLVGTEARLRLGYVYWVIERDTEARTELQAAANAARDPDLKYLARYLLGWFALQSGNAAEAKRELMLALEARPNSQSAALALASIELREGEAAKAYERAEQSLAQRRTDDDPWRLFLYGHHPHLPKLIADLRSTTR